MLEEVDRLSGLVDRLLTLSRAESGQAKLSVEVVDLRDLAEEVVGYLGVLAEEKRQTITVDVGGRAARSRRSAGAAPVADQSGRQRDQVHAGGRRASSIRVAETPSGSGDRRARHRSGHCAGGADADFRSLRSRRELAVGRHRRIGARSGDREVGRRGERRAAQPREHDRHRQHVSDDAGRGPAATWDPASGLRDVDNAAAIRLEVRIATYGKT